MKYAIGVDIGGTKISMVLGNRTGKIFARYQIDTEVRGKTKGCLINMVNHIAQLKNFASERGKEVAGVGICLPGAVDTKQGIAPVSPHLPGWQGVQLRKMISKKLRLPVHLANDANAAAIAEMIFGQAKRVKNFIYMTVSTGVGGGIVVNGHLLEGTSFVAGEIGHMTIDAYGEPWALGEYGCLEAYASGTAIARYVDQQIRKRRGSKEIKELKKLGILSAKQIAFLARKKDKLALEAFARGGEYLGIGIGNLLNIFNPQMIILGGGVWKSAPSIFKSSMLKSTKKHSWKQAYDAVKIVRTKLGDDVGNLGALALVYHLETASY